ncbi:hypothetical protein GBAR_LOCUS11338 [Geodia barretti]|uniref:Uncharacterized protein n=1 Tax=Geodia barretti TaxID=519541 RepID=A0AA35RXG9_GEOBA|nr:hypothetical protein GBAR_LOCUS11338 [Geodia barretti]
MRTSLESRPTYSVWTLLNTQWTDNEVLRTFAGRETRRTVKVNDRILIRATPLC